MSAPSSHRWEFFQPDRHSKTRDPQQAELLRNDAFSPAESLVRESIQNSLDAHDSSAQPVHVRITVSGARRALTPQQASRWLTGLRPHVEASESGGHVDAAVFDQPCRYVVIEDFSTTGLTGDVRSPSPTDGGNYYSFIWAEGISQKSEAKGGRWGVGKYVFPKASGINAFFALTTRAGETTPLMIGQAVLQQHRLGGQNWMPDGWWADQADDRQTPFRDEALAEAFRDDWLVSRQDGETGLSIVIPFADSALTADEFVDTLIRTYWLAILEGRLSVDVVDASTDSRTHLEASTVMGEIDSRLNRDDPVRALAESVFNRDEILSDNRLTIGPIDHNVPFKAEGRPAEADLIRLRDELATGRTIEFAVRQRVKTKDRTMHDGEFSVLITRREELSRAKPQFFRSGILVSDTASRILPGIQCVVIVGDDALGTLLGDSESPAHTKWLLNDRVKSRYVMAKTAIDNVRQAPFLLMSWLDAAQRDEDRIVFSDVFSVTDDAPSTQRSSRRKKVRKRRGAHSRSAVTEVVPKPPTPPLITVSRSADGSVHIVPTTDGRQLLGSVKLTTAYALGTGRDPFKKWSRLDFCLDDMPIETAGATIVKCQGNQLRVDVTEPEAFSLTIAGFDPLRDLALSAQGSKARAS